MSEEDLKFIEIGKVSITDKNSIAVSSVVKHGVNAGIHIHKYVAGQRYTDYSKGVFVPADKVAAFIQLINKKAE